MKKNRWKEVLETGHTNEICEFCQEYGNCKSCPMTMVGETCYRDGSAWDLFSRHHEVKHPDAWEDDSDTQFIFCDTCRELVQKVHDAVEKAMEYERKHDREEEA